MANSKARASVEPPSTDSQVTAKLLGDESGKKMETNVNGRRQFTAISVLFLINLLNYIDRYTVAGVLIQVQDYYSINGTMAGLIQTVFLVSFMLFSPICGYLGDRFNRKWIVLVGMIVWLAAVVASTFAPKDMFWLFLLLRSAVGIGEASYSTVAPSMISDMFTGIVRSRVYMVFYFAIPVGSGLGFIVGSNVASLTGAWQWGVRVSGFLGIIIIFLHIFLVYEPARGDGEKAAGAKAQVEETTYWQDFKALIVIPSFLTCLWGYTALVFVSGTLVWWEPTIIEHLIAWKHGLNKTDDLPKSEKQKIGLYFGVITLLSGLIGVTVGSLLSTAIRQGTGFLHRFKTERAPPLVSGAGALIAAPLLLVVLLWGHESIVMLWILMFTIITVMCFNWGLNVDMLMTVIVPSRRNTAFSYMMLISHLFGDASGPYILGKMSDLLRNEKDDPKTMYFSLVHACYVTIVLLLVSTALYFACSLVLVRDQEKFKRDMGIDDGDSDEILEKLPIKKDAKETTI